MAVMSFFACVSPQTKFLLFFVVPVPAWALVSGFFLWDGYTTLTDAVRLHPTLPLSLIKVYLTNQYLRYSYLLSGATQNTKINGAGHVGGMLAGGVYYLLKRRFIF